ncbi:MAG: hypothetical protein SFV15_22430 [Polyangiaceae bacterium]|nr:hypothetical protein [Polyangiaceae bacterium]
MVRRLPRVCSALVLVSSLMGASALVGCAVSKDDVHRWANRSQGARRLVAVVSHDKYPMDIRVEAVRTLIEMKPRKGRRIGLEGGEDNASLVTTIAQLPPAEREKLLGEVVPILVAEMSKPPAPAVNGVRPIDTSYPFKDAAFALLIHEDKSLLNDATRAQLRAKLAEWCMVNFAEKMDDSSQLFGVEQVMKELKNEGARLLPTLIVPGAQKIDRIAQLIADLGNTETKGKASEALVLVAKTVDSPAWMEQKRGWLAEQNKISKLTPTPGQFQKQLEAFQEEELLRVFSSMKKVGGKSVVEYLLAFAQKPGTEPKRRAASLAALEGNLDRNSTAHADALLSIAGTDDTPDMVRQVALARVGEMPRKLVVEKLFTLFDNKRWQVRWVAAELVLKMSDTSQLAEFMARIARATNMALSEPLQYGSLIGGMKGPKPVAELVKQYAAAGNPVQVRLSALGYFYSHGVASEVPEIGAYTTDTTPVPQCAKDAEDCEWKCTVGQEAKEVKTLGEYVDFCVKPAMATRTRAEGSPAARGSTKG